jgi:hypothetical protein
VPHLVAIRATKEKIMVDVYTKAVLTVIAVALSAIAIRSAVPSALALGEGCGNSISDYCYVYVTNSPL